MNLKTVDEDSIVNDFDEIDEVEVDEVDEVDGVVINDDANVHGNLGLNVDDGKYDIDSDNFNAQNNECCANANFLRWLVDEVTLDNQFFEHLNFHVASIVKD